MKNNILKKFLQLALMAVTTGVTIFVFLIILFKTDQVIELLSGTVALSILFLIIGGVVGFLAGAIVCFLNISNKVDKREKEFKKLKGAFNTLKRQNSELRTTLDNINTKEKQNQEKAETKRKDNFFGAIENFPIDDEEVSEEEINLQEEESEDLQSEEEFES